jgi:hypothetical protein
MNPILPPPHILHCYQFLCKVAVAMFDLVYLTPYMVLKEKHERLGVPLWMLVKSIDKQPD